MTKLLKLVRRTSTVDPVISPDKMLNQTRKLAGETARLSDLTHRLFWLTIVLGIFALLRYVNMILDFYDHS